jgi:outer membrane phospholipase A
VPQGTQDIRDQGEKHRADKDLFVPVSAYESIYFLYGADPSNAKFQLSLKVQIFHPRGPLATEHAWLPGFHFGYTQTSFWDLASDSKPFEDTSYKPELFYLSKDIRQDYATWISRLDFQTGLQHESNGRDYPASRSLNILYIKPLVAVGDTEGLHFTFAPKIWIYVGDMSENPDIEDYRGYFDLLLKFGSPDGMEITTNLRKGTEGGKGSVQIDFMYPLSRVTAGNLGFYFHAQYFTGYAEDLLNYDEKTSQLRVGLAFIR